MEVDGLFSMMDMLVLVFGFYALYASYVLRRDGKIIRTFLVFKETDLNSCKDLQGYANYMAPKLNTFGIVMIVYGVISMLNTYVLSINNLFWVMFVVFLVVLAWYAMEVKRAMKKYF